MKTIALPSGIELKVTLAPFTEARALYQAMLSELKDIDLDPKAEIDVNLYKNLFCAALESKKIEDALWACMKRCLYNGSKVTEAVFEPEEARGDYLDVCMEVARLNVLPFGKSLFTRYKEIFDQLKISLELNQETESTQTSD